MFRGSRADLVRVICVSMLPEGGCMTNAMTNMGFTPYSFRTPFAVGNGGTHPTEWHEVLTGKKPVSMNFFDQYDCLVGPPSAIVFDKILKASPAYTKVVLVEEPDKDRWAADMDVHIKPLLSSANSIGNKSRVGAHVHSMLQHMFPRELSEKAGGYAASLEEFEENVKAVVPEDRLLVWRHGDGYEPLCEFLNIEKIPEEPFPPYDTGIEIVSRLSERLERANQVARWLTGLILVLGLFAIAPVIRGIGKMFSDMYQDYQVAYQEAEETGETGSVRQAMIVAKKSMVSFEDKWKSRGAISIVRSQLEDDTKKDEK